MIIIKTTTDSHKAMKLIANTLLNKKLAACVNMIPRMRSKYVVDGRITESREVILLIKTTEKLENKVYKTKDKKISPYMSVDAGLGFYVNNSETLFFDVGLSYSMFTNIDVLEYKDYQDNTPPIFNDIGKVIGADYRTLFIGLSYEF